jgi:hypothetical protein
MRTSSLFPSSAYPNAEGKINEEKPVRSDLATPLR